MRQDIDRRVGDEIDVVGAVPQRGLDIAGREIIEKLKHALAVELFDHFVVLRRCWARLAFPVAL
jgi:hypothetical protein